MTSTTRPTGGLFTGFAYPFQALVVINRRPQLWKYILIPVLLNIVVALLLYSGLLISGLGLINELTAGITFAGDVVRWLLQALFVILLLVAIGFLVVRFGVVLGAPWYGKLSEELESDLTGSAPPASPLSPAGIAYDLWRAIQFEAKKLALLLALGLPLLLLNFIPGVGQILATAGSILLGTLIACLDFFDSPLERRRLRFRQKLAMIKAGLPASAGFGLVCFGLVSIPLLNLLAIPLCVTAGTIFFCEQLHEV